MMPLVKRDKKHYKCYDDGPLHKVKHSDLVMILQGERNEP